MQGSFTQLAGYDVIVVTARNITGYRECWLVGKFTFTAICSSCRQVTATASGIIGCGSYSSAFSSAFKTATFAALAFTFTTCTAASSHNCAAGFISLALGPFAFGQNRAIKYCITFFEAGIQFCPALLARRPGQQNC
jgi:hypothetical protein